MGMGFAGLCSVVTDLVVLPALLRRGLLTELGGALGGGGLIALAPLTLPLPLTLTLTLPLPLTPTPPPTLTLTRSA